MGWRVLILQGPATGRSETGHALGDWKIVPPADFSLTHEEARALAEEYGWPTSPNVKMEGHDEMPESEAGEPSAKENPRRVFPPGVRVLIDGRDEAIVREAFPQGSTSFLPPHYRVDVIDGDKNVKVAMGRIGTKRELKQLERRLYGGKLDPRTGLLRVKENPLIETPCGTVDAPRARENPAKPWIFPGDLKRASRAADDATNAVAHGEASHAAAAELHETAAALYRKAAAHPDRLPGNKPGHIGDLESEAQRHASMARQHRAEKSGAAEENPAGPTKAQIKRLRVIAGLDPFEKFGGGFFKVEHALKDRGWIEDVPMSLDEYKTFLVSQGMRVPDDEWLRAHGTGGKIVLTDQGREILRRYGGVRENPEAADYPDAEAALLGAQSKHDATHAVRGRNITIFSPTSRGYLKRVGFQEKGFYHWPEKGDVVQQLPPNAEMIYQLIDVGWDPEAAPEMAPPVSHRRAAEEVAGETFQLGDRVIMLAGKQIGMGRLREDTSGEIDRVETSRAGTTFYGVSYIDRKGKRRHTYADPHELRHAGEAKENPIEVSDGAVPWVKVTRDPKKYAAAMVNAEEQGPIKNAHDVYNLEVEGGKLGDVLMREDQEVFCVILLDVRGQARGISEVHRGGRSHVDVSIVDVLRVAILRAAIDGGAEGFACIHNHPTTAADPSKADRDLTKAIRNGAKAVDLTFVDHVVIGGGQYYSFESGKLHRVKGKKP